MENRNIKMGVAGLGRMGTIHAWNIHHRILHADLVALCDEERKRLADAPFPLDPSRRFASFSEMLGKGDLDAVVIATPSEWHGKHIGEALAAGLHVFCEKPLGTTQEDNLLVRKAVQDHPHRVFMPGYMRRYDESYQYAKQIIDRGEIGRPVLFRSYTVDPLHMADSILPYIPHSSGQFLDMAVHDIDLARWMIGSEPVSIYAIGGCFAFPQFGEYGDGDNVSALMQFENGTMAFFLAGRTSVHGYNVETEIIGTKAAVRIGSVPQKNLVEVMDSRGIRKECSQSFEERFSAAFIREMQEFVDCILQERKPDIGVDDGVQSSRIAMLATKSFRNNELIRLTP